MTRRQIVITEFMDEAAVATLAERHDTRYDPGLVDRGDDLRAAVAAADVLVVRNRTQVNPPLLAAAPRLRVVGRLGVGLDNIDLAACAARNVDVIPATGANALAVAEYVIATAMLLLRGAYGSSNSVSRGDWPRGALSNGREIGGKTLGVVGFGGIGRLTARLARGVGMKVIAHDAQLPPADPVWAEECVSFQPLDTVLRTADVVTLHVPLTPATRHLVDAAGWPR